MIERTFRHVPSVDFAGRTDQAGDQWRCADRCSRRARCCCARTLRISLRPFASSIRARTLFATNWHIELIAAQLAAVRAGRIRRLLVNLPPRHLKSHLASVAFAGLVSRAPAE